jgi:putative peptidoglycan lipid II flippase
VYGVENIAGTPVYVHAKVCVIDDQGGSVGSDNFNRRSWTHDSELTVAVWDEEQTGTGARRYPHDLRLALAREHLDQPDAELDVAATFAAFAGSAAWVLAYVLVGQVGLAVTNRVASAADEGAIAVYANAWLLLQVPYGVLGVSLLTVLMPRMSAAAAAGRVDRVVDDLALGTRLSVITLLPVAVGLTAFGPALGVALFSWGRSGVAAATVLGETVAASAFGLLPLAVVMLQLRVFYALDDARTPTMIMLGMTAFRVPAALLTPQVLPAERVVLGLAAVNAFAFGVGAVVGWLWLRVRLGPLHTRATLGVVARTGAASALAVAAVLAVDRLLGAAGPAVTAWRTLAVAGVLGTAVCLVAMWALRVPFPRRGGSAPHRP